MLIIPAMDLIDNQVVRLNQGDYQQKTIYSNDALAQARIFLRAGFSRLHIVDLSGAKSGQLEHLPLLRKIKQEINCAVEYGGGIRDLATVDQLFSNALDASQDYIMMGSLPFKNPLEFRRITEKYAANIVITVDVWGELVRISGWQEQTQKHIFELIREMQALGLTDFLVTQIKKDGMMSGPDFELYEAIWAEFKNIRLIASGGVSSLADLQRLAENKSVFGAILGKAYYEGKVLLDSLKNLVI